VKKYFVVPRNMPFAFPFKILCIIWSCYKYIFGVESTCDTWLSRNSIVMLFKLKTPSTLVVEFENNIFYVEFSGKGHGDIHYYCDFLHFLRTIMRNTFSSVNVQELVECPLCKLESFTVEDLFHVSMAGA
jgi:hypothetical protein